MRLHIGIFGRRNVGKSSILNALVGQEAAIVSEEAGTTTDPVEKPMELLPLGPVLFVDTAGIDDVGALGAKRIEKTKQVLQRTDLAMVVTEAGHWGKFEDNLVHQLHDSESSGDRGIQQGRPSLAERCVDSQLQDFQISDYLGKRKDRRGHR